MITINKEIVDKVAESNFLVMRERFTNKPLGISFSEDGLRMKANKNGVYIYCEGRVTNIRDAKTAPRSRNIYVEKFVPNVKNSNKIELHYVEEALHYSGRTR